MRFRIPRLSGAVWTMVLALIAAVLLATWPPAQAAGTPAADVAGQSRALARAANAVLGLQTQAVDDARSNRTLGRAREGSGVVIGADGLVLTIGYLILEADQVQLVTDDERVVPARVLGYDIATGFGLVQALVPLRIEPVPLGQAAALPEQAPLMMVTGGEDGGVSVAQLVSRRAFSGFWEYHIDGALFTAPPRGNHSGAGLFNERGELVGVGSLFVADALGGSARGRVPGNMFVPVDLLPAVLPALQRGQTHAASQRAWLGVNCAERDSEVHVIRVSDDSPAEVAGLKPGDRIVRIDGAEVTALEALWKSLWSGGEPERDVALEILRDGQPQTLTVHTVDRMKTLRRSQGI